MYMLSVPSASLTPSVIVCFNQKHLAFKCLTQLGLLSSDDSIQCLHMVSKLQ